MRYIKVEWIHNESEKNEPVWLYSEINDDRFEVRKLDEYSNGEIHFADTKNCSGSTRLGIESMPELADINSQESFEAREITKEEFEEKWHKANCKECSSSR